MKVFVSSLISGMEQERASVRRAIEILGHHPVMAEDFGARPDSPQVACLSELRGSDLVVLLLGARYGARQQSGLSATHEEFAEARGTKPILAFVRNTDFEPDQATFVNEVQGWEGGLYRDSFRDSTDLGERVVRAFHNHLLASATAPLDPRSLRTRASEMLQGEARDRGSPILELAIASGPPQTLVRPAQMEEETLSRALQQRALFGEPPLFDLRRGTTVEFVADALVIGQDGRRGEGSSVTFWPGGDLRLNLAVGNGDNTTSFLAVIQEDVSETLSRGLAFATWLLDYVDSTQRITHVALAARIVGSAGFGWRTAREQAASPNSGQLLGFGRESERDVPVMLSPPHMPRQALAMDAPRITQDLVALLRRQWTR